MKIVTKLSIFFAFIITAIFPVVKLHAVTMNPSSGTYAPGTQVTITVTAAPTGAGSNAVAIRLTLTNATVVSFTPVTGGTWVGATQDCAGPAYYTSTTVCASLAKSVPIVSGETLGTLVIQLANTSGTATITRASGNVYSDGVTSYANNGTAATFTISGSGGTTLPDTALTDTQSGIIIGASVLLIAVGAALIKLKPLNNN